MTVSRGDDHGICCRWPRALTALKMIEDISNFPTDEEECQPLDFAIADKVDALLGSEGGLADYISGYRPREQQIEMARKIAEVFADPVASADLVIEAPTGIGKTLAYALPALMSGRRVLISTATRYLQDQLYSRDLRLVLKILDADCQLAQLKGRRSYACLDRLNKATPHDEDEQVQLEQVRLWSAKSRHGDLDKFDQGDLRDPLIGQITSTSENCTGRRCSHYQDCFVYKARREALKARVVVTNHTLLLHDLQLRNRGVHELLPESDVCIFDEAHRLLSTASDVYSIEVSIQAVSRQLAEMADKASEDKDEHSITVAELASTCANALLDLHQELSARSRAAYEYGDSDEMADDIVDEDRADASGLLASEFSIAGRTYTDFPLDEALESEKIRKVYDEVLESLIALAEQLDRDSNEEGVRFGSSRLYQIVDELNQIAAAADKDNVEVISYYRISANATQLCMIPFDLSQTYSEQIKQLSRAAIYTSATLCAKESFEYFTSQLGLGGAETMIGHSDFDYANQSLLWLPTSAAENNDMVSAQDITVTNGYQKQRERQISDFVSSIAPTLRQVNGRSLILLTSKKSLRLVAAELERMDLGILLLVQGEQPSAALMNRFLSEQPAILLGMATFWEGVDIRGSKLVFVAIDKLPFEYQKSAVNIKRQQFMSSRGQNFFKDYLLPKAVLRLKQGMGRLIRDYGDFGIVAIGDDRIFKKSYGRTFLDSLPPFRRTRDADEVMDFAIEHCGSKDTQAPSDARQ